MPPRPLRIRPAARSRRVAPAPKPKARPKRKAKDSSANPPSPPGWIDVKKVAHDTFPLGSLLHLEVFYQDETGDMVGKLEETHQDTEGIWLGIAVKGTKLTGLRSWRLTHPGAHEYLYVCYQDTPVEKRLKIGSVAYLVRAKKIDSVPLDWGKNCEEGAFPDPPLPGQEVETAPLRLLAENLEAPPCSQPQGGKEKIPGRDIIFDVHQEEKEEQEEKGEGQAYGSEGKMELSRNTSRPQVSQAHQDFFEQDRQQFLLVRRQPEQCRISYGPSPKSCFQTTSRLP